MAYLDNNGVLYLWSKIKSYVSSVVANFYTKPSGGIPASDLAAGVIPDISGKVDKVSGYGIISQTSITNGYQLSINENGDVSDFQVVGISAYNNAMQQAMTVLNGKADASALDNYALKSDISSMYKYKGSVATVSALPSSGNTTGDVYNVEASGMNYAWDGSAWDALGETFTITAITNAEIDTICT